MILLMLWEWTGRKLVRKEKAVAWATVSSREWDLSEMVGTDLQGKSWERKWLLFGKEKALRERDWSAIVKRTLIK